MPLKMDDPKLRVVYMKYGKGPREVRNKKRNKERDIHRDREVKDFGGGERASETQTDRQTDKETGEQILKPKKIFLIKKKNT